MNKYVIVPLCSDLNRGDQALVWETKRIAEASGFIGEYFLVAKKNEPVNQSKSMDINILPPILEHPSRFDNKGDNVNYSNLLKLKWGVISLCDLIRSYFLINPITRKIAKKLISKEKKNVLKVFQESDGVIMKGGGFIHAYGGITCFYYMYYVLYNLMLAQSLNKEVYIMPNSFGPFEGMGVKWLVSRVLKKCKIIYSRESISTEMLNKSLGINAKTMPDLAFFLGTEPYSRFIEFADQNYCVGRKKVAVTMRPYRFPNSEAPLQKYQEYKQCLCQLINWLYDEGYMPVIIEHTLATLEHENDARCISEVVHNISGAKYILVSDKEMNCKNLKWIYGNCDYIVGTRFHSVIFSLSQGIPGIAITYGGNKGEGIMKDIGLDEYSIPIEQMNIEEIKQLFLSLVNNEEKIKIKISKYIDESNRKRAEIIQEMELNRKHESSIVNYNEKCVVK